MKRLLVLMTATVAFAAALPGCETSATTPHATFAAYREAVVRKDWKASLNCLTPQAQDKMLGGLVLGIAGASIFNGEAADLLEKHGIDRGGLVGNLLGGALAKLASPDETAEKGIRQSLQAIPDKPAFFAEGMAWLEENNKKAADTLLLAATAQLTDVEINGDTATGKLSAPIAGNSTLRFAKVNGRWLIDL
jgi:hypothetical protein